MQPEDRWRNVILIEIQTREQREGGASWWTVIEVQGPWKWKLRRSFGGDGRNDPRKNRETRMEGKRCNGKFQRKRGKKRNGGKRNRTDVEIEKEFWARIPGICGGRGSVFIVTVFRVLNVGEVECLKLKLGCIGVKIEKKNFSRK